MNIIDALNWHRQRAETAKQKADEACSISVKEPSNFSYHIYRNNKFYKEYMLHSSCIKAIETSIPTCEVCGPFAGVMYKTFDNVWQCPKCEAMYTMRNLGEI